MSGRHAMAWPNPGRHKSDSVKPAELAWACNSARSAPLARTFTHTARPALMTRRYPCRGQRGHGPPPGLRTGRTECGPKGYAEYPRRKSRQDIV